MAHICLFCTNRSAGAGNCSCGKPYRPIKKFSDYSGGTIHTLKDFNPSCRRIAMDLHVKPSAAEIYVVVRCGYSFEKGPTGSDWGADDKRLFKDLASASVGLWDSQVTVNYMSKSGAATNYSVLFFLDEQASTRNQQMKLDVVSSAAPQRMSDTGVGDTGLLMLPPGAVVLRGPYAASRPSPASGNSYDITVRLNQFASRTYVHDNSVATANQKHANTMAHEYGHMIGLPDEYDDYPLTHFATTALASGKVNRNGRDTDKDKTVAFWVELLGQLGETSPPFWGHEDPPGSLDDSIMRTVDTRAGAFKKRHYVTVVEGLNLLTIKTGLNGIFTM